MPEQMPDVQIHPQLLADCHRLGRFAACHLLLHHNAALPWFILVPVLTPDGVTNRPLLDLLDLDADLRGRILGECALVSGYIKTELGLPRVNVAAIGNLVPQLHLHVVGRAPGDACWPAPVWGHLRPGPEYAPQRLHDIQAALASRYHLTPTGPTEPPLRS